MRFQRFDFSSERASALECLKNICVCGYVTVLITCVCMLNIKCARLRLKKQKKSRGLHRCQARTLGGKELAKEGEGGQKGRKGQAEISARKQVQAQAAQNWLLKGHAGKRPTGGRHTHRRSRGHVCHRDQPCRRRSQQRASGAPTTLPGSP
jgi:hypothetical protein